MTKPYSILVVVDYDRELTAEEQAVLRHRCERAAVTALPHPEPRVLFGDVSDGVSTNATEPPSPSQPLFDPEWLAGARRLLGVAEMFVRGDKR